ncbi:hypothetical protein BA190_26915 [Labrys sp. WJW]|uniref:hypothetical protein n=1 Tax=Labrys sp. WJW TaxID=1737983 RepID=UPI00082BA628|nr:hypothetical protein [Labrys sp. WJW]OCC01847.1 hypothetical protein BA190_26915 [Labrys sp. WJW]
MSANLPIVRDNRRRDLDAAVGQTVFTLPVPVFDLADVVVYSRLVATEGVYTRLLTGFTLAFVPGGSGSVQVTFTTAPRTSESAPATSIRVEARRVQERVTNATRNGVVQSSSLEADLDRISTVVQELRRDIDDAIDAIPQRIPGVAVDYKGLEIWGVLPGTRPDSVATVSQIGSALRLATEAEAAAGLIENAVLNPKTLFAALRALGLIGTTGTFATFRQIGAALADIANPSGANVTPIIRDAIDPLGADAASQQWNAGAPVSPADDLYVLIQTTLGWSSAQMTTFMTLARSKPA